MKKGTGAIPVEVRALMLDPSSNLPIVILHEPESDRFLPIWIGLFEAQAIAMTLEGIEASRPMTHDLFHATLADIGARVVEIVVNDLQDSTFFAQIVVETREGTRILDSRPSDAIALALRAEATILVDAAVLEKALEGPVYDKLGSEDEIRKWLEEAEPEEFGKYEM